MTERLYYQDAYLREFTAAVRSCAQGKGGWLVTLDRTAFYPEGGGQPGDRGTLGGVPVLDTHEQGGEVVHLCAAPLPAGETVSGALDWDRRFDHMQQHSGEHILSGILCRRFSCDNVGFHLGAECVVIDFNAPMGWEELLEAEAEANAVLWENRPFLVSHPGPEELEALPYRSKKALSGDVRIVECPGADRCACCGTHVRAAGEIGLIKLLSVKPFREGVRIEMLAGRRAYEYVRRISAQNHAVSVLTSAPETDTAGAVERLKTELAESQYRSVGLENRLFAHLAEQYAGRGDVLLRQDGLSSDALRRCALAVAEKCGGACAVFSGADGEGYRYALSSPDASGLAKRLNAACAGRGGGKNALAQGSVSGAWQQILDFFQNDAGARSAP